MAVSTIIGNSVSLGLPKPNLMQENPKKGDYVYGKDEFLQMAGSSGIAPKASVEPADEDIPKVYITGDLPTSKSEGNVQVTVRYISKTMDFTHPATLKVQGSSSANYNKKNFTLNLYEDESYENKVKVAFKSWPAMSKFVLKAHWMDHSHVRNVGTAKIWGKIVAARSDYDSLPEELRNSPNNGATDGFTCKVFANGVYQGLYEWIVAKDKLFGQDSNIATHSIMNSELNNQDSCAFATTSPAISGNWSEELQDSMSSNISTSFTNFIKFVAESSDAEFVANAENYFDVQSVIDYNILARLFCVVDNLCRNQIFFTYDGNKWYEGVWDLDAVLGLPPTTRDFFAYDTAFQTGYIAYKDYGVTNRLYQRVETLFMDRFKVRYAELRAGVLSIENILEVYERLTDVITTYDGLLAEDFASTTGGGKFTGIPYTSENNIQQIRDFVAHRIPFMDATIAAMTGIGSDDGGDDGSDDGGGNTEELTVAESFEDSIWTRGYLSDNGEITTYDNLHHSQMIPVDITKVVTVSIPEADNRYLRISYYDADKNYIGYDRGAGINVGSSSTQSDCIKVNVHVKGTYCAYFVVNCNSIDKSYITVDIQDCVTDEGFTTSAMPIAQYIGSDNGDAEGSWEEVNGGNSISMDGGTWSDDGILSLDGSDDYLKLPLNNAKTVTIRMKLLSKAEGGLGCIFDCRKNGSNAYLIPYNNSDYVCTSSAAYVYAGTSKFENTASYFYKLVMCGQWVTYTIVFGNIVSGNMLIGANNKFDSFSKAEISEIKVYDVDITAA